MNMSKGYKKREGPFRQTNLLLDEQSLADLKEMARTAGVPCSQLVCKLIRSAVRRRAVSAKREYVENADLGMIPK